MSNIPVEVPTGAIRYNTDSNKMECFNGTQWMQISVSSSDLGGNGNASTDPTGNSADQVLGFRGVFGGGQSPTKRDTIDYVNISSTGNAIDFGNLIATNSNPGACASSTKGFWLGGETPSVVNTIQYIQFAKPEATATDYADLDGVIRRVSNSGCSNATRGLLGGGYNGSSNVDDIEYFTMSSNATAVQFGNLTTTLYYSQAVASPTRGVWMNGENPSFCNTIQFVTIASTGNASDFGDTTVSSSTRGAASNSTRGIAMGGKTPSAIDTVEYITIASTGNASDFGNLASARANGTSCASPTRILYGGGGNPSDSDVIDYTAISTGGTAVDFGNLTQARAYFSAVSNGHGGL